MCYNRSIASFCISKNSSHLLAAASRKENTMQQRLEQFKRSKSLRIFDGMPARWPSQQKPGKINPAKIIERTEGDTFAINNGVVAFVTDGELFVAPYQHELIAALEDAGFSEQKNLFVPFSMGDMPQGKALKKWERLVREAHAAETAPEATLSPQFAVATA